jgi:hypothetical protein
MHQAYLPVASAFGVSTIDKVTNWIFTEAWPQKGNIAEQKIQLFLSMD